jgi:hypothetical protein
MAKKRKKTNKVAGTEAIEGWLRTMDKPVGIKEGDKRGRY